MYPVLSYPSVQFNFPIPNEGRKYNLNNNLGGTLTPPTKKQLPLVGKPLNYMYSFNVFIVKTYLN